MSPEAAYFPDALASTLSPRGEGHCASDGPSESLDTFQSRSDKAEGTVGAIAPELAVASSEISGEQLLKQIKDGDKEALGLLFRRYARAVRNVALRILRNESEADDLVQEVFLFIFRKATLFDPAHGAGRSWIFQVAYHRAFDRRRYLNSRNFYTSEGVEGAALHLADPREVLPFHERSMDGILGKRLSETIKARLSPEQGETIQLYFFEGYALKEIAQRTGRSLVNVRSHYYRGLERLRQIVLPEKLRSK